jgi:hypothetical protein
MKACNASTAGIEEFLNEVDSLKNIFAIKTSNLHPNIKSFRLTS